MDSSALLAVFFDEPEKETFADTMTRANKPCIGAPNLLEASMIIETRQGAIGCRDLDELNAALGLDVVAFDPSHLVQAREAFRRFGKGRHRAALNFGDCCAYGLAKSLELPLLFKGNGFALTDIKRAI